MQAYRQHIEGCSYNQLVYIHHLLFLDFTLILCQPFFKIKFIHQKRNNILWILYFLATRQETGRVVEGSLVVRMQCIFTIGGSTFFPPSNSVTFLYNLQIITPFLFFHFKHKIIGRRRVCETVIVLYNFQ